MGTTSFAVDRSKTQVTEGCFHHSKRLRARRGGQNSQISTRCLLPCAVLHRSKSMCWAGISSRNDSVTRHVLGFLFILLFMYLFLPRREITFGPPPPPVLSSCWLPSAKPRALPLLCLNAAAPQRQPRSEIPGTHSILQFSLPPFPSVFSARRTVRSRHGFQNAPR